MPHLCLPEVKSHCHIAFIPGSVGITGGEGCEKALAGVQGISSKIIQPNFSKLKTLN